jgi:hypothetical protein
MDDSSTYDVRVYRTDVFKGAEVATYRVRWKTGHRHWREGFRNRRARRQLPQLPDDSSRQGRDLQPQHWPAHVVAARRPRSIRVRGRPPRGRCAAFDLAPRTRPLDQEYSPYDQSLLRGRCKAQP